MEHFKHIDKVSPTKLELVAKGNVVVMMGKDGIIHCYKLYKDIIVEIKQVQVPFLIPYCIAEMEGYIYVGGLDIEQKGDARLPLSLRKIHKIEVSLFEDKSSKKMKIHQISHF